MRFLLYAAGVIMAVLAVMIIYGSTLPETTFQQRAKRECDKIHPHSEIDSNNCQISLTARYLLETRSNQMDRAYDRARQ